MAEYPRIHKTTKAGCATANSVHINRASGWSGPDDPREYGGMNDSTRWADLHTLEYPQPRNNRRISCVTLAVCALSAGMFDRLQCPTVTSACQHGRMLHNSKLHPAFWSRPVGPAHDEGRPSFMPRPDARNNGSTPARDPGALTKI